MALQAIGSFSMCNGFCIRMDSMGFSGHIKVKVFAGAATGVVRIQISTECYYGS